MKIAIVLLIIMIMMLIVAYAKLCRIGEEIKGGDTYAGNPNIHQEGMVGQDKNRREELLVAPKSVTRSLKKQQAQSCMQIQVAQVAIEITFSGEIITHVKHVERHIMPVSEGGMDGNVLVFF